MISVQSGLSSKGVNDSGWDLGALNAGHMTGENTNAVRKQRRRGPCMREVKMKLFADPKKREGTSTRRLN